MGVIILPLFLIDLVLRDLNDGWFGLGFAKSRGMGLVKVQLNSAVVQYPGCILKDGQITVVGRDQGWDKTTLLGAGTFLDEDERQNYGFPANDVQPTPVAAEAMDLGFGVQLIWKEGTVFDLFKRAVESWKELLQGAPA